MGILDNILKKATDKVSSAAQQGANKAIHDAKSGITKAAKAAAANAQSKRETFTFSALPTSLAELQALPEADLSTPFKTAALVVAALNNFENDRTATIDMLDWLSGPREVSTHEQQFLRDQLGGKMYVIRSYFAGTSPENNYTPTQPYSVTIFDDPYSYQNEGMAKLDITSSGADSPRQVLLRLKPSEGKWYLYENYLLSGIRIPKSQDVWA